MFFLKKHKRDYLDCDEFGWWLTGSKPDPQIYEDVSPSDGVFTTGSNRSVISCADDDRGNSFLLVQESSAEVLKSRNDDLQAPFFPKTAGDDTEEICYAEEPLCKTSARSYTPERLVRTQDYTILSPSPTFSMTSHTESSTPIETPCKRYSKKRHRRLNQLIDQKLVGASHLTALLDPDALDIEIPVSVARRKILNGRFLQKESSFSRDLLAIANSDSPRRPLSPDLMSSGSSCERLNCECHRYDNAMITGDDSLRIEKHGEVRNLFERGSNSGENFLGEEICTENTWKGHFIPETNEDAEIAVQHLRGRIDNISNINKDIFGDIYSLRKNFQCAEQETGNLTTETTRLRQEIRDLRYLDDLVNLLRGELERISRRNWPFILGHTDHHADEVNLVV